MKETNERFYETLPEAESIITVTCTWHIFSYVTDDGHKRSRSSVDYKKIFEELYVNN